MQCIRANVASSNDLRFAGDDSAEEQQQCSPKKTTWGNPAQECFPAGL